MCDDLLEKRKDRLIEEYKICSTRADSLTTTIWQPFSWFIALVGLGLGFLAQREMSLSLEQLLLLHFFSFMVVYLLAWWNRAADQWNLQQRVLYARLTYLED